MKRLKHSFIFLILVCCVLHVSGLAIATEDPYDEHLLEHVLVADEVLDEFSYLNLSVLFDYWQSKMPESLAAMYAASWEKPLLPYVAMTAASNHFRAWLGDADAVMQTSGLDLFAVRQIVEVGAVGRQQVWLGGKLDTELIKKMLTDLDYSEMDKSDETLTLLAFKGSLDDQHTDCPRHGVPFFGGKLGRCQPVLLADYVVATTRHAKSFETLLTDDKQMLSENESVSKMLALFQEEDYEIAQMTWYAEERVSSLLRRDGAVTLMAMPQAAAIADLYKEKAHRVLLVFTFEDDARAEHAALRLNERLPGTMLHYLDLSLTDTLEALNGQITGVESRENAVLIMFDFEYSEDIDEMPADVRAFADLHKYLALQMLDWHDLLSDADES
ncbi:MAG TPA: hypothetical protein GXZ89_04020 [Fastidiosipila sp.]|nr:hypothetical protein [Fastidiosipila sp.]